MEMASEEQARKICADLPYAKLGMLSFDIYGTLPDLWPLIPSKLNHHIMCPLPCPVRAPDFRINETLKEMA